ncbi:MAG: N-acetylmuramoyl-L-alanine amidase, partial [Elusimicrobia bacterium]|nr:N-acetylmuramoyl-L-alanine amidase [Elusimicrobiota bacterium]
MFLLLALSPAPAFGRTTQLPVRMPPAVATPRAPLPDQRPIVIDAGHGGRDWGATVSGRFEKDIALAVALKLRDRLQALGLGPVRMTRDCDEFVPLDGRVREASAWDAGLFISLHANQVRGRAAHGITVYAYGKGRGRVGRRHRRRGKVPPLPAPPKERARSGVALGVQLARSLREDGLPIQSVGRAEFYVLKNPGAPSVLVELGYLSNPAEAERLADPEYQDRLAAALANGLAAAPARWAEPAARRAEPAAGPGGIGSSAGTGRTDFLRAGRRQARAGSGG